MLLMFHVKLVLQSLPKVCECNGQTRTVNQGLHSLL